MDFNCNQSNDDLSEDGRDLSSNNGSKLFELVYDNVKVLLYCLACICIFLDGLFCIEGPDDLGSNGDDLTWLCHNPICLLFVLAVHPLVEAHADDSSN